MQLLNESMDEFLNDIGNTNFFLFQPFEIPKLEDLNYNKSFLDSVLNDYTKKV